LVPLLFKGYFIPELILSKALSYDYFIEQEFIQPFYK